MATDNRGVMVYLPSEVEAKMIEYCTEYNITRKDKQGNIVTSLGSGIVAYLKSQLLGDTPKLASNRPATGLTREEVLDLIAESITSNTPIARSPAPIAADVLHRLETILLQRGFANEQQLSSSTGISRDEVEQLIQVSEHRVLEAVRMIWTEQRGELVKVQTVGERINKDRIETPTNIQNEKIENTAKSPATALNLTSITSETKPMSKDLKRWMEPLKDNNFRDIIQTGISDKLSNQEIVTKLFEAGYGKDNNTQPYPANLASAMKTAFSVELDQLKSNL